MKTKSIFEENLNKNLENIKKSLRTQFSYALVSVLSRIAPEKSFTRNLFIPRRLYIANGASLNFPLRRRLQRNALRILDAGGAKKSRNWKFLQVEAK